MNHGYRLIRRGNRGGAFYCVETATGKRTSLRVASEDEARQLIEAKNQAQRQPLLNLQIGFPVWRRSMNARRDLDLRKQLAYRGQSLSRNRGD